MISEKIKKDIERSRAVLSRMLMHIEQQTDCFNKDESTASLWNEKDSLLSAHSRIIQLQVKLAESELRFKQESLKLKKMEKELQDSEHIIENNEEQLPPLAQEEWDALFHAFERHKPELEELENSGDTDEENNYAVLLK